MTLKVCLRSPLMTVSGYGVHSRQIARFLLGKHEKKEIELFVHPLMWGSCPWTLDQNMYNGLIGKLIERSMQSQGPFDISFQLQLPNEHDIKLARKNIGISACVETDKCNPEWVNCVNNMDAYIVPSTHVKRTLENTGQITSPMHVIPESFPDEFLSETKNIFPLELLAEFNYLIVGQLTADNSKLDRKGILKTIKWLCEEFDGDPNTGIVIKTNMGRNTKIDRELTIQTLQRQLPERKNGFPRIHLVHGFLTDEEMLGLYKHPKVKAFVGLPCAEGYCLPALEAAAVGLPVVMTNWSGHLDFLNRGKFIKIDYELKTIPDGRVDNAIFMSGTKWAIPNERDFKKKIQKLRTSYDIPKQWALELQKTILEEYCFDKIRQQYENFWQKVINL